MKRVSINFWMIFDRNDDGVVESTPQPRPVSKDLLKKVRANQGKILIYANQDPEPARIEGREPEFQKEIIFQAMRERLDKAGIPFFEVAIDKPYAEININEKIIEHVGWEKILIDKLKK